MFTLPFKSSFFVFPKQKRKKNQVFFFKYSRPQWSRPSLESLQCFQGQMVCMWGRGGDKEWGGLRPFVSVTYRLSDMCIEEDTLGQQFHSWQLIFKGTVFEKSTHCTRLKCTWMVLTCSFQNLIVDILKKSYSMKTNIAFLGSTFIFRRKFNR